MSGLEGSPESVHNVSVTEEEMNLAAEALKSYHKGAFGDALTKLQHLQGSRPEDPLLLQNLATTKLMASGQGPEGKYDLKQFKDDLEAILQQLHSSKYIRVRNDKDFKCNEPF